MFQNPSMPMNVAAQPSAGQPFAVPLGSQTGTPPRTRLYSRQIPPQGVLVVSATRENRFVTFLAPTGMFGVWIAGESGVTIANGFQLPVGQPFEVTLPGNQEIWAITNAVGVSVTLNVQVTAALLGERERRP